MAARPDQRNTVLEVQFTTTLHTLSRMLSDMRAVTRPAVEVGSGTAAHLVVEDSTAHLSASDGELSISSTRMVNASESGAAWFMTGPVEAFASTFTDDLAVDLSTDDTHLTVTVPGLGPYAFPLVKGASPQRLPEVTGDPIVVPAGELSRLLAAVTPAADPSSNVVEIVAGNGRLSARATDAVQLHEASIAVPPSTLVNALFPARALSQMLRREPRTLNIDPRGRFAELSGLGWQARVRLSVTPFPNVAGVLGGVGQPAVTVATQELTEAVRRLSAVAGDQPIGLHCRDDQLELRAGQNSSAFGSETVSVTPMLDTPPFSSQVSHRRLADMLSCHGEVVGLHWTVPRAPVALTSEMGPIKVVTVVMPLISSLH